MQDAIGPERGREQCSPVCPGPKVSTVVQATPPKPKRQSTEVEQFPDVLWLVILITVDERLDVAVWEII